MRVASRLDILPTQPLHARGTCGKKRRRSRRSIDAAGRLDRRRAALAEIYGRCPHIAAPPDATPTEVLILRDGEIHGWAARILDLADPVHTPSPFKTLGDLRRATDAQLLAETRVGKNMLAQLRRYCPLATAPSPIAAAPSPTDRPGCRLRRGAWLWHARVRTRQRRRRRARCCRARAKCVSASSARPPHRRG
jgi:hypothetical protein